MITDDSESDKQLASLVQDSRTSLVRALSVKYGADTASDAVSEAVRTLLEVGPNHQIANPIGYAYRIADRAAARMLRREKKDEIVALAVARNRDAQEPSETELLLDLSRAIDSLSVRQRQAVMLVKAWGYTYAQASQMLEISEATLANHLTRGLDQLRMKLDIEEHFNG